MHKTPLEVRTTTMNMPMMYFYCICIGLAHFGFKTLMFHYKSVLKGIELLLHVVKCSLSFGCSHTIRSNMPIVSKSLLNHALFLKILGLYILCFMIVRAEKQRKHQWRKCRVVSNISTFPTILTSGTGFLPVSHTTHILGASSVLNIPCSCVCSCKSHINVENGRRRNSETMGSDAIVIHNIYSRVWDFWL